MHLFTKIHRRGNAMKQMFERVKEALASIGLWAFGIVGAFVVAAGLIFLALAPTILIYGLLIVGVLWVLSWFGLDVFSLF